MALDVSLQIGQAGIELAHVGAGETTFAAGCVVAGREFGVTVPSGGGVLIPLEFARDHGDQPLHIGALRSSLRGLRQKPQSRFRLFQRMVGKRQAVERIGILRLLANDCLQNFARA